MTGLYHGWSGEPQNHADFVHGAVDPKDFTVEVNYAPRRKKKGCKKGKGAPCVFTKKKINSQWYSTYRELWAINSVMVCERCGKHDWTTYGYTYSKTPIN